MAVDKQQSIETQVREIIADWTKTHDFIQEGIEKGLDAIVNESIKSCESQQKGCEVEVVNAAYDYKKVCNNEIVATIDKIIKYQSQTSENKRILEDYIKKRSGDHLDAATNAISNRLNDLSILRQQHKKTGKKVQQTQLKSKLNDLARIFFKETSIFEHKVNKFIDQIPIQVFVLSNDEGNKIGFFSYDGNSYTVLETIASTANMTLDSGTSISFNMTMAKAQKIVDALAVKSQSFGGTTLKSLANSTDPSLILNNNLANFIQIQAHQQMLTPVQQKALELRSEFQQFKKVKRADSIRLQKYGELIRGLQGTDQIQINKIQEFTQTLNDMVTIQELKRDSNGEVVTDNKGQPVYTYATQRRVVGLKGATEHQQQDQNGYSIQKLWETIQSRPEFKTIFKVKKKADFYGKLISDEHKEQYFNLNKGQLKEAFFGYYFQLEHGFTTVNSGEDTYLIYREDFPSYIAAMDNARARLWGDYNAKIGDTTYAVSVKSEGAGMDIKQFILLADFIINYWQKRKKRISNDSDIELFKEMLKRRIKRLQMRDVKEGVAQKSEILSDVASYHIEGEKNLSVNQMLNRFNISKVNKIEFN